MVIIPLYFFFMASWEKQQMSFWPTWQENKLFTLLLAFLFLIATTLGTVSICKGIQEIRVVGFADQSAPTITVSATGKSLVKPDIATTDMTVTKTASTATEAQNVASVAMKTVIDAVKALGVPEEDLTTSNFNTSEVFDYDVSPAVVTGYQSTQSLTVKIRNTDLISSVLDAGPKNGATQVSGIRYSVDDDTSTLDSARKDAIAKAEWQAVAIATSLHARIGRVVNYNESSGGNYPMYSGMMVDSMKAIGSVPPPVEIGQQTTEVTVSITYSLN